MRLSNYQIVSLIQRVVMTVVLRLIMNGSFSFDSANHVFRVLPGFMGESLVIAGDRRQKLKQNVTTKIAHEHEQSEFTYGGYLVAAEHL